MNYPEKLTEDELLDWLIHKVGTKHDEDWDSYAKHIAARSDVWVLINLPLKTTAHGNLFYPLKIEKMKNFNFEPILAFWNGKGFEIEDGRHRLIRARDSGYQSVPAYIPAGDEVHLESQKSIGEVISSLKLSHREKWRKEMNKYSENLNEILLNLIKKIKPSVVLKEDEIPGTRYNDDNYILFKIKQETDFHESEFKGIPEDLLKEWIIWGIHDAAKADYYYQEKSLHEASIKLSYRDK